MIPFDDVDDEFLSVATQAMSASSGGEALSALGWWDLLGHLDDPDARSALLVAFRAQGRALASSQALGGLLAAPFLEGTAAASEWAVAAVRRTSTRRGPVWVVVGDVTDRPCLFADPSEGLFVVDASSVSLTPIEVPGALTLHEATFDASSHTPLTPRLDERAYSRSLFLGRLAAATEILGATERAVALAVDYARDREQFGIPIGTYQAIRHLLAWARTDCVAIDATARTALDLFDHPPAHLDKVVKALAGRNGRRACERSLQVLGGIGFTAEHAHHHHHSRVLLLDSLLGTSAELSFELGKWLRETGSRPDYAHALVMTR